jgi:hypothetical protein
MNSMRAPALALCLGLASCLPIALVGRFDVADRAAQPPVCSTAAECDAAWATAVDWVTQHCAFNIQTRTDLLVETEGPLGAPNTDVACRLERVPAPEAGSARLELTPSCGSWFDCDPERVYLEAKFNDDVRAAIVAHRQPADHPPDSGK